MKPFIILLVLFATYTAISAQIIYTDFEPDIVVTESGPYFYIDINNDGTNDLTVASTGDETSIVQNPYNTVSSLDNIYCNIEVLDEGVEVDNLTLAGLYNGPCDMVSFCADGVTGVSYGYWSGVSNKFVGFWSHGIADTHYGWIRVSISEDCGTATIHDMVINNTEDESVVTGVTTTAITNSTSLYTITLQNLNQQINLSANIPLNTNCNYKIFDLTGRAVADGDLMFENYSASININNIPDGVYFINLYTNGELYSTKFMIR